MSSLSIVDLTDAPVGLLVTRSQHFIDDRGTQNQGQIGIIVEKNFYNDASGKAICWPSVHWENASAAHTCHPSNVAPFREHAFPVISMVEG